jgi:two-component system, OmpR family, sensor histidine kinase KdpD
VNLLENALKFSSPADAVAVSVRGDGGHIFVRVRDQGPGIPEADRERIFDPFERGSTAGPGSGLGLAIARGFAEANGGRVWIENADEATGGSTFVLELPATEERPVLSKS